MKGRSDPRDATPAMTGRLVGGRYRLGDVVGRGGMATIYRARDTTLDRTVALKLLRPEIVADPDLADRFRREALAATVLRHRNIVGCLDTGSDPNGPYMVMELIDGEDLAAKLRRDGPMLPDAVARIGLDVARGLGAAHLRGIVHRDVKPSNILLARDGRAMITDFGIARLAADAEAALPGTTLGSVQYFSPEQAQGTTTTPASDVYGLGLVLYEALTGRRPWHGETSAELALARVGAPAPSPRDVRPEVPLLLDVIVTTALAPAPGERYTSGNAFAAALEPLVGPPVLARSAKVRAGSAKAKGPAKPTAGGYGTLARVGPARTRRRLGGVRSFIALGIGALLIGGFAMFVFGADADQAGADPSAEPTAVAERTPSPTSAAGTDAPGDPTTVATSDVCRPTGDTPCALKAGAYAPDGFSPAVAFSLGKGWSTSVAGDHLLVLSRPQGLLTFASGVRPPRGTADAFGSGTAKAVVAGLAATPGITSTKPAAVTIDGHKGRSIDVTPTGNARQALFKVGETTFSVEPRRTTRVVALDTDDGPLVLVIEPKAGKTLRQILATADDVASTIRFR